MDQTNNLKIIKSAITQLNEREGKSFNQLLVLTFAILAQCKFSKYIEAEKTAFEISNGDGYGLEYYNTIIDILYAERKELSQTSIEIEKN